MSQSDDNTGPVSNRLIRLPGPKDGEVYREQRSVKTLWTWRRVFNVANDRRDAALRVLQSFNALKDAIADLQDMANDVELSLKKIDNDVRNRPRQWLLPSGGNVSDTWPSKELFRAEPDLPDRIKEAEELIKRLQLKDLVAGSARTARQHGSHRSLVFPKGSTPPDVDTGSSTPPGFEFNADGQNYEMHPWDLNRDQQRSSRRKKGGGSNSNDSGSHGGGGSDHNQG